MINIWIVFLMFVVVPITSAQQAKHVDSKTFFELIKSVDGIILDVRTQREYDQGHIENSTLISINDPQFVKKANLLQKDKPIYVYCLTGSRSFAVVNYLSSKGFSKVYNLQRGILEWRQYGYSITQAEKTATNTAKTFTVSEFYNILKSNDVVLVDFHATWCAPCKKMAPIIAELEKKYTGKAKVEKLDVQANETLQRMYKVESVPGLVLFKDGKEVWKHTGLISYNDLSDVINQHL